VVPIVEPEVLMDGPHGSDRCEEVTGRVLQGAHAGEEGEPRRGAAAALPA
jgi:fructose-bisphosphate aldolase class 1